MGEAQHFERGQAWRAKNTASIKLRTGDGRQHPIQTEEADVRLSDAELTEAVARRDAERARLAARSAAIEVARRGAAREMRADAKAAEGAHTPPGWVPANRRSDFSDPLSRANDPRRSEGTGGASRRRNRRARPTS